MPQEGEDPQADAGETPPAPDHETDQENK